ncbi:hypothetical protein EV356DRAFT_512338 [Viridothelium virens]|uniref:Rhodopsin domain-containing protein n=1 Tax=Viridothelium virens TaxID=1048519 RepID=A0A6A6HG34_VIRVR|nr:hypothetical protein EV356DRAFT_512338 [Viridothelium virens]
MEILARESAAEASRVTNILVVEIVVAMASTIAVGLRIFARTLRRVPFGGDDLAIVLALPVAWGIAISTFLMVRYGYGKHGDVLPKSDMKPFTQSLLSGEILWTIAIPLIKVSICLFYRRIFGEIKYMRYATSIIAVFSVCWGIMYAIVLGLQCRPLAALWDKSIQDSHCIEQMLFCFIGSAMNVFTDFVLLALPVPAVWHLHISIQNRLQVCAILALGTFASTVSLARFAILLHWQKVVDPTWNYYYPYLFCTIEVHIGIVSACLPTLRPLVQSALAQAKDSIGRSSGKADTPDPEQAYRGMVHSKSDESKSISQTYSYKVVVRPASSNSGQSGDERLMNPNDISFWTSIDSHA